MEVCAKKIKKSCGITELCVFPGHPFNFSGIFEIGPRQHDELGDQFRFR